MADDAAPFLLAAGQITGHIGDGQQRDIECIAKADKAGGFIRCIDIQATGQHHGLIGDDAHRAAVEACETDHDIRRKILMGFEDLAIVYNAADHGLHIIALVGIIGNNGVEGRDRCVWDRRRSL